MSVIDEVVEACQHCGGDLPCIPCSKSAERPGVKRSSSADDDSLEVTLPVGADKGRVAEMLRVRGMDPDEWVLNRVKVNEWEGFYVDRATGEGVRVPLQQTTATLDWIRPPELTEWGRFLEGLEAVAGNQPAPPRKRLKPPKGKSLTWFAHGDDQAPFINRPLHELTCEALRDIQPDAWFYTGDGLDLPDISRHKSKEGTDYHATSVECIDCFHQVLVDRIDAEGGSSDGRRWFTLGNHDIRIDTFLRDKAPQLFGIRRARTETDPTPSPLLSVRSLTRLDELGFQVATDTRGDYPYGTVRIADELLGTHGWLARKGAGATAQASIQNLNSGILVGHTHRLAVSYVTRYAPDGEPIPYSAAEAGTMAMPDGLGYSRYPDWQNGWLTVTVHPDGSHHIDPALYRDGVLRWRDRQWRLTATGVRVS